MAKRNGKSLVVVESPTKAKTIGKYLGGAYDVRASYGHVRDLPKTKMGVDLEGDLTPRYLVPREKKDVVERLRDAAKRAELVYLATDLDREGEAIAWHVAQAAGISEERLRRVVFSEITAAAVREAFEHPRDIDRNLVDAQQARRVIDRLVGYTLSPVISGWIRRGLSAGRVQSAALRLIVDREHEIRAFVSEEYWSVHTDLLAPDGNGEQQGFSADLIEVEGDKLEKLSLKSEDQVRPIVADLERSSYRVEEVERKERRRHPAPPFTTSTLQQEAARKLGFSSRKTMTLAQQLYQGIELGEEQVGLITYMRTDSVNIADSALDEIGAYVRGSYGSRYALESPRRYKSSSKRAQEAHEAIRPTSVERTPESVGRYLSRDQARLYDLIWKRTVATQMTPAVFDAVSVDISASVDGRRYVLRATGQTLRFDGFLRLYQEGRDDDESPDDDRALPPLERGAVPALERVRPEQHFTQPPPRFTEASLVKELESLGIGRPSTYAHIIGTLQDRHYVELEQRRFSPTELGERVTDALKRHFPEIVDVDFTARMEEDLDRIATGEMEWKPLVRTFYDPFARLVEKKEKEVSKEDFVTELDRACPECERPLVEKFGRFGKFIACTGYPECQYSEDLRGPRPEPERTDEDCPECGEGKLVRRVGRYGPFLGCERYPECTYVKKTKARSTGASCPDCGEGELVERRGRRGRFFGCSRYPKCRFTINQLPLSDPCPECEGLVVEKDGGAACRSCGYVVQEPSVA